MEGEGTSVLIGGGGGGGGQGEVKKKSWDGGHHPLCPPLQETLVLHLKIDKGGRNKAVVNVIFFVKSAV